MAVCLYTVCGCRDDGMKVMAVIISEMVVVTMMVLMVMKVLLTMVGDTGIVVMLSFFFRFENVAYCSCFVFVSVV